MNKKEFKNWYDVHGYDSVFAMSWTCYKKGRTDIRYSVIDECLKAIQPRGYVISTDIKVAIKSLESLKAEE